ncbi:MAG: hypothetical protein IPL59_08790 [Candidatus Competibacteraceae bacterium]|nr:hypothetical protein [Candidatus Competibacteraceae bacterium]
MLYARRPQGAGYCVEGVNTSRPVALALQHFDPLAGLVAYFTCTVQPSAFPVVTFTVTSRTSRLLRLTPSTLESSCIKKLFLRVNIAKNRIGAFSPAGGLPLISLMATAQL